MLDLDFWWGLPLLISLLVGSLCPAAGSLLITQRRILLANLMAHSVLPGLVLALAFELDPSLGGLISGLIGALVAEQLTQRFRGSVLLVPLLQARVDLESILFGDILASGTPDLIRTAISAVALVLLLIGRYQDLVFIGVDPEGALAAKRPVRQIRFITIVVTALVVISAITAVGIVLVIGLLCAPVLIHVERSTSLKSLMLKSAGTGLLLCGGGMMLAVLWDLPPGPLIGVLCMALLIVRRP